MIHLLYLVAQIFLTYKRRLNILHDTKRKFLSIYADSKKQIFIAFDKQDAYTAETRKIVTDNKVLKLSDNHCELYGESWNVEEAQSENKL